MNEQSDEQTIAQWLSELDYPHSFSVSKGPEWGGKNCGDHLEFVISEGMTKDQKRYLVIHEFTHWKISESGHNTRFYTFLLPLARSRGIPYSVVREMEDGQWWDDDLCY